MTCFDVIQVFFRTREVGEFLSGALAGAMTKAVLAPLETIRLALLSTYMHFLFHEVNVFVINLIFLVYLLKYLQALPFTYQFKSAIENVLNWKRTQLPRCTQPLGL